MEVTPPEVLTTLQVSPVVTRDDPVPAYWAAACPLEYPAGIVCPEFNT
jgi:hypothetical protein